MYRLFIIGTVFTGATAIAFLILGKYSQAIHLASLCLIYTLSIIIFNLIDKKGG